jgi:hypothetical protein
VEFAVAYSELTSRNGMHATGMRKDTFFPLAQAGEIFIDEERAVMVVECSFASNEVLDLFKPTRMIDEFLERFPGFIDLLKVDAIRATELV